MAMYVKFPKENLIIRMKVMWCQILMIGFRNPTTNFLSNIWIKKTLLNDNKFEGILPKRCNTFLHFRTDNFVITCVRLRQAFNCSLQWNAIRAIGRIPLYLTHAVSINNIYDLVIYAVDELGCIAQLTLL